MMASLRWMLGKQRSAFSLLHSRGQASTSRSLFDAFNSSVINSDNHNQKTGLFGIEELKEPEGFRAMTEQCIDNCKLLVQEALNHDSQGRIMTQIFDELSNELCCVADLAEFVRLASPSYSSEAEQACITISGLVEQLNTHRPLYDALKRALDNPHSQSPEDLHVAELLVHDFEQSGIHLDSSTRSQVVVLNDEVLRTGQTFGHNCHSPTLLPLDRVSERLRHRLRSEKQGLLTLKSALSDNEEELVRKEGFSLFYGHSEQQEEILQKLLQLRHQLASVCGFQSFKHRALQHSLASHPNVVEQFLTTMIGEVDQAVNEDLRLMSALKSQVDPVGDKKVYMWDVSFLSSVAKRRWTKEEKRLEDYFSLGACMQGLNDIFTRIFGVQLSVQQTKAGELWHPQVYKLGVSEVQSGSELGHIYCDFFVREGKPLQDCHFTIRGGCELSDGSYQNPVVVLMLNLPMGNWHQPSLLSSAMVDNLFHEMGHAMHSMLARTKYQHVTGTRCATDLAEIPSNLMEYFASDPSVLSSLSCHYKDGSSLPPEQLKHFCLAKKVFGAVELQTQAFYALLDQNLHANQQFLRRGETTTEVLRRTHEQVMSIPYVANTAWQHRFGHLVGYGARYYSYLMARAVASCIWHRNFKNNPLSSDEGERLRYEFLAHGGGKPAARILEDYLGESHVENLASVLVQEVHSVQTNLNAIAAQ